MNIETYRKAQANCNQNINISILHSTYYGSGLAYTIHSNVRQQLACQISCYVSIDVILTKNWLMFNDFQLFHCCPWLDLCIKSTLIGHYVVEDVTRGALTGLASSAGKQPIILKNPGQYVPSYVYSKISECWPLVLQIIRDSTPFKVLTSCVQFCK